MNSTAAPGMPTCALYDQALARLACSGIPFLIGGAFALERYTGITRDTKDLDIFLRPEDADLALAELSTLGCRTYVPFPHWLAKAATADGVIDFIFSSGNGVARVDDGWFEHAVPAEVLGIPVKLCPPEETIWSKALIMERERYDGADVAHVIHAMGDKLDWRRVVKRYDRFWRVLYSHLILFGFIYPSQRSKIPAWLMQELERRLAKEVESPDTAEKTCYGTILSRQQYLIDVQRWGYKDARLKPLGTMSAEEIAHWTAGIAEDGSK
jgi:Nucleotidyl transferase of unknown function (DUF2204)